MTITIYEVDNDGRGSNTLEMYADDHNYIATAGDVSDLSAIVALANTLGATVHFYSVEDYYANNNYTPDEPTAVYSPA